MRLEPIAVHGGYSPEPTTRAVAVPVYQTTSCAFDNTRHAGDLFDLKVAGNIYTRIMNPIQDVLEKRVAEMEGGIAGLALASGRAAITYSIQTISEAGDDIVSASTLCGGTYNLFAHTLPQFGIEVRFADYRDPASFEELIDGRTKALYCESVGNPLGNITDFERLAEAGARFQDALKLVVRLVNIGDCKSLACHPASTTHRQLSPAELARAGVTEDMVRLSIGIEHIDDILEDIDQALRAAG